MANVSQWEVTAGANDASPPDGWPEGMPPSTVNDAAREMMAALARWYQDQKGVLVTGGSGNNYTLTTNNGHSALSDVSPIVFRANRTSTGTATLNVDGLGAKNLRAGGSNAGAEAIQNNSIYLVAYNAQQDAFDIVNGVNAGFFVQTSREVNTGDGLTGGGDLSDDRTLTLGTPSTVNGGTSNAVTGSSHTHAVTSTVSRSDTSTTTLLAAAAMHTHRQSTTGDHDQRYIRNVDEDGGRVRIVTSAPTSGGSDGDIWLVVED